MAKLDPDSAMSKSVKDIMDEQTRKRKREEELGPDPVGVEVGKLTQGPKSVEKKAKKIKKSDRSGPVTTLDQTKHTTASDLDSDSDSRMAEVARLAKVDRLKSKKEQKKALQLAKQEKKRSKREKRENREKKPENSQEAEVVEEQEDAGNVEDKMMPPDISLEDAVVIAVQPGQSEIPKPDRASELRGSNVDSSRSTLSPSSAPESPIFDVLKTQSGASSISSIVPPTNLPRIQKTAASSEDLRARLQTRIDELRANRRADGPNGAPAKNRQELLEARQRKEDERKAHKKELRLRAREEEREVRERALIASVSPSIGSPNHAIATAAPTNNFSFGRVAFTDGQQMDANLTNLLDARKRKGPQDPLTALKAADSKRSRLSGLDEEKRKDIEEKDLWLNARKRVHGERIRDDTSLLKKALKRKEKTKKKSESEWKERLEGVEKGKDLRQKKREDNLRKRREEKGTKGGKKAGAKKGSKGKSKKQNRPGFEGSFKSKAGSHDDAGRKKK